MTAIIIERSALNMKVNHNRYQWLSLSAWAIFAMIAFVACSGHYGRLKHDNEVTRLFRTNTVPEDYSYYYVGRENLPYAIIGIHPDYEHQSKLWHPVEPNSKNFAGMVDTMWQPPWYYENRGAYIVDQQGRKIGIWYSPYHSTSIFLKGDGIISVASPYNPSEDEPELRKNRL